MNEKATTCKSCGQEIYEDLPPHYWRHKHNRFVSCDNSGKTRAEPGTTKRGVYIPPYYLERIEASLCDILSRQDVSSQEFVASRVRILNRAAEILEWLKSAETIVGRGKNLL